MQDIYLCSVTEIDADNQKQIDFASKTSQYSWFDKQNVKIIQGNVAVDTLILTIDLNTNLGSIRDYDYLWLVDENNNRIFYFITAKKKKNAKCTVALKCDVFQTYMFRYKIHNSFVERCHVPRWSSYNVPTMEIIDEGLPLGEYRYYGTPEKIAKLNESFVIASTTPLGELRGTETGTPILPPEDIGGGNQGEKTEISNKPTAKVINGAKTKGAKAVSQLGLRFVKGYEGFAQYGAKFSGKSFNTVAYGITEKYNPDYYNRLKPFPCSEGQASISLASIVTANYTDVLINQLVKDGVTKGDIRVNELDAMLSISMNMGVYEFMKTQLYKDIVKYYGSIMGPYTLKNRWLSTEVTSSETGQVLEDLKNRRIAEFDIFSEAKYNMRSIQVFGIGGKAEGILQNNKGDGYLPKIS